MDAYSRCGLFGISPKWLQYFATTRSFIVIYGLLGTIQAMSFIYISVSLTALEKRFKIPSQTTGILLSGNEISQIMSVILVYYGASGHRPRWIAVGVAFSALSCFVLALPHFIYGPGQEALALTHEFLNTTILSTSTVKKTELPICSNFNHTETCNEDNRSDTSILPRFLVFLSQFILGIGTTLYYGLGQVYMDDNTKKKNAPLVVGVTFSLRTVGPVIGFVLSYFCLRIYVDPSLHPIIDDQDPRWLGAWWLGWIILGVLMAVSSVLLAMFPKELKKSKSKKNIVPKNESEVPLKSKQLDQESQIPRLETPNMKNFIASVKRIMKNKLFLFNTFTGIFFILGSAPFIYFIGKYIEVQYGMSSGSGTIIAGPMKLVGIVLSFLISGIVMNKYKPSPRPLLGWNVVVGLILGLVRIGFIYITCDTGDIQGVNLTTETLNLTSSCNAACHCDGIKFSPVCHEPTKTTFFSACHAGCRKVINDTAFGECQCISNLDYEVRYNVLENISLRIEDEFTKTFPTQMNVVTVGPCKTDCFKPFMIFSVASAVGLVLGVSGRIGNVIVSYRCVETRDKSLAQGLGMLVMSLLAMIPAPIVAGALMDSTCLIWDISCKSKGNCWVYHKDHFNYVINITGAVLIFFGVICDALLAYYSKDLDLYGEQEEAENRRVSQLNKNEITYSDVPNPTT